MKCEYCGKEFSKHGIKNHIDITHLKLRHGSLRGKSNWVGRHHTNSTKEKLRQKRFEYLKKKSGQTAWERKANGEMSNLEQWFFDEVIVKYKLLEKFDIVNEYPEYPYFIDFAFINIKLAVELDGKMHFENGNERIEHDLTRDKDLQAKGWTVYRIAYFEKNESTIHRFLEFLNDMTIQPKLFNDNLIAYHEIKEAKERKMLIEKRERQIKRDQEMELKINQRINDLKEIDITKYGSITKLSKKWGVSHTHVRRMIKHITAAQSV